MPELLLTEHFEWVLAMLGAGLAGGLLAGLLGVGGGIVIVPVLYLVQGHLGVDDDVRMKLAIATSLATIVFTSLSSAKSHAKRGTIDRQLVRDWIGPIFFGVVGGTALASVVPGLVLTAVFATVASIVAVRMILSGKEQAGEGQFPNKAVKWTSGIVVGGISALMGIGGGTVSVPILSGFGYDIRRAVGTASALGFVIAIPGTIGYALTGWDADGLPAGSLGYVNLIALALIVPTTMATAPAGAWLAHRLPRRALGAAFGIFLAATALRMFYDIAGNL